MKSVSGATTRNWPQAMAVLGTLSGSLVSLFMAGCSSGSGSIATPQMTAGAAYLGALSGSSVSVYALPSDGSVPTSPMLTTSTNSAGTFRVPRLPLLIAVAGGAYQEEATGNSASLAENTLRAAYTTTPSAVLVSPFSEAIVADAQANGGLTQANLADASDRMTAFLEGTDALSTMPTTVAAGAPVPVPTPGNWMAFALGTESQMRTEFGIDHASAVQAIVGQMENGDTLDNCNGGSGDPLPDGTLTAPQGDNCAVTQAALHYAANPLNNSGITSIAPPAATIASPTQYATVTQESCGDRISLLRDNQDLFDGRKADVQADIAGKVTLENWTFVADGKWGPSKATYGAITAPATCTDVDQFRRELVMAVENYWIDHGLNYCHHHIPGWLPPDDSKGAQKYRNSTSTVDGTSGGGGDMTCTAQRSATGEQKTSSKPKFSAKDINWQGVDCSNFTAWTYDFAGLVSTQMSGEISTQSCSVDNDTPGVLLDINSDNFNSMVGSLRPGDLLYITKASAATGKDSYLNGTGENSAAFKAAHVVTWTGKRWSDLQAGADRDKYDVSKLGAIGSRLGGDLNTVYLGYDVSLLGTDAAHDPWMIIDSHFAGPAYRPFVPVDPAHGVKGNWYGSRLSAVRRIIGALDAQQKGSPLKPYVMEHVKGNNDEVEIVASPQANAQLTSGRRLIRVMAGTNAGCQLIVPSK